MTYHHLVIYIYYLNSTSVSLFLDSLADQAVFYQNTLHAT